MSLKQLTEERARLVKQYGELLKGSNFSKEKADKLLEDIHKKDREENGY